MRTPLRLTLSRLRCIRDLVAQLVAHFEVDAARVFAGGHSSGGIFLYSFVSGGPANDPAFATSVVTPLFRAFSPSGANQMAGAVDTTPVAGYASTPSVSVLHLHGGDDTTQHWQVEGGPQQGAVPGDVVTSNVFPGRCTGAGATLSCTSGYDDATTFYTDKTDQFWFPVSSDATPAMSSVGAWAGAARAHTRPTRARAQRTQRRAHVPTHSVRGPPTCTCARAGAAQCDASAVSTSPAVSAVSTASCEIERHAYTGCPAGVEAHAIRYAGVGHTVSAWDTRMQFFERFCSGGAPRPLNRTPSLASLAPSALSRVYLLRARLFAQARCAPPTSAAASAASARQSPTLST